jgi:hypothetical protein
MVAQRATPIAYAGRHLSMGVIDHYNDGWIRYKHKYLKFFNQSVEFTEAENTCKLNKATMCSIHSSDENLFVLRTSNNQFSEFTILFRYLDRSDEKLTKR